MFFVATTYFFVTHIILERNANLHVEYFFVGTTIFCATHLSFMLPNVSIKNIMNKEKQMRSQ